MANNEYVKHLEKRNKELERTESEHKELEYLINWMQDYCIRKKAQFCGIQTLDMGDRKRYVGFALLSENVDEAKNEYAYSLFGFLGEKSGDLPKVYIASLMQHIVGEIPDGMAARLELVNQNVRIEPYRNHGIGTCAMYAVKDLAKQLHCGRVTGRRSPMTEEEEEKLWNFYQKNGFCQPHDTRDFSFDVTQYRSDTGELV